MTDSSAIDLTCWYINQRRLMELLGPDAVCQNKLPPGGQPEHLRQLTDFAAFKQAALHHNRGHAIEPLEKLLLAPSDLTGRLFTHHAQVWFKGLVKLHAGRSLPPDPTRLASGVREA